MFIAEAYIFLSTAFIDDINTAGIVFLNFDLRHVFSHRKESCGRFVDGPTFPIRTDRM
jgi:hypothetical protein